MPEEPIDIVYLWCDDADPVWHQSRLDCARRHGVDLASAGNGRHRVQSNDDLRYSLRSLDKCAPWIRRVFLVIADSNRPPAWLRTDHPRLRIVRHSEFMPARLLPCFNSETIEHHLWNIPDLAERFLLANDDMMFYRPVGPDFFYAPDGFPYCRYGSRKRPGDLEKFQVYRTNLHKSAQLLLGDYGARGDLKRACSHYPHHNIDAYLKSDVRACFERYKSVLQPTFDFPFRHVSNFERFLYNGYAIAIGHGHYRKANSHAFLKRTWWKRLLVPGWAESLQFVGGQWLTIEKRLALYHPALFCCNDTELTTEATRRALKDTYARLFPGASSFEVEAAQ